MGVERVLGAADTVDGPPAASTAGVTESQRMYFEAFGYVVLRGLFATDIGEITDVFDAIWADPEKPRYPINYVGHRFNTRYAMGHFLEMHPTLTALARDPRLVSAADTLLGQPSMYLDSDGNVYCCETEWHYDSPIRYPARRHVKFMVYLDPVEEATGAPRVLPLSHHDPSLYQGALQPYLGFEGGIEERTGIRGEELPGIALSSQPGDVIAWDFALMHASYGSTAARRQIAVNFCTRSDER
jgi:ectoine hydroxylase-related dioxygenase (phytanoyl-CoA dioxygenase family)